MRSPFPGMDPYLESPEFWPDFHSTFINCWREAIAEVLPDGYEARIDERVSLVDLEEIRETYIKILHGPDRSLVSVLELLSPTNKADIGFGDYLSKRGALLRQRVHLVELDLLIGGTRVHTARPLPGGHYYAIVARWDRRPDAEVYAWTIRDRLPEIRVPLKVPDPDIRVDLAPVFATAFERGRYVRSLRYERNPEVPVVPEDIAWCAELARPMVS